MVKNQNNHSKNKHKVNMIVKGNLRHLTYKLHALIQATILGLKTNKLIKHPKGELELEFEGDKQNLWKMVKWSKKRRLSSVKEVIFSFTSISTM